MRRFVCGQNCQLGCNLRAIIIVVHIPITGPFERCGITHFFLNEAFLWLCRRFILLGATLTVFYKTSPQHLILTLGCV